MTTPIIRKAETRDIPHIQRLYRQLDAYHVRLLPALFQAVAGDVRGDDVIRDRIDRNDADYLLAELDGKVIGFLCLQRSSHPHYPMFRPHEFAVVEDAIVDEAVRGQEVGTHLFRAAMDWARDRGLRYVQTTVWHENDTARRFYLAQGFLPKTVRLELDLKTANNQPAEDDADKPRT
ncbi:MAG: GNAT family N-acetyltransferase [Bradymonadales bacterium]|nr:GNAT family N-acetyltransferase [Bradymonadales bacterium]